MAGAKTSFALLALGAAALLPVAGCGGGSKSSAPTTTAAATTTAPTETTPLAKGAYVNRMRVIGRSLSTSIDAITSATTAATAAKALETLQSALRTAADKIEATIPPEEIKTQHARLVKAVRDFADGLSPIIAKVKAGTLTALSQVGRIKGYLEVQVASSAIANKGYKIGG